MPTVSTRYKDELAKSAEYLRQALPLMSQQTAGLHPVSYAVWYEFVSGINPELRHAIELRMAKGEKLDDNATSELFRQYIADIDENEAERINAAFQRILNNTAESAAQAGSHANAFTDSLERVGSGLGQITGSEQLSEDINRLLGDTRNMQDAVGTLQARLLASQQEIEMLKKEVCRAREEALLDALTGLVNRKGLDLTLDRVIQESEVSGTPPSIVIADIDHFKNINDTYGHLFGDKVIRAVSHILSQNVKGKDTAARYGGEEFVLLLPETPLDGAKALAESIRGTIEHSRIRHAESDKTFGKVTVSFGVTSYHPGEEAATFVERADKALYASKQAGRNRVTVKN